MLRILMNALRTGVVTKRYPQEVSAPPERFRGVPRLQAGRSVPSLPRCPAGALIERSEVSGRSIRLDVARCVSCGRCAEDSDAIGMGRDFELAARSRGDLCIEVLADGTPVVDRDADKAARRVESRIHHVLGRSLHLRHLDAGSCNACDWELTALLNPVYDVRRLGIDFVASPRHADGVVVTGPVTRNLRTAVLRTFEAVPDPRIVIAMGACAASGGLVGASYASAGGVGQILPVDVYIPGCPPRPEAIIFGILLAVGRLDTRRAAR